MQTLDRDRTMLFALPAAFVTGGGGLVVYSQREHIYKGASWVYNEWAERSAGDEAKQTPDAEEDAKLTPDAEEEAKQTPDATS